MGAGNVKAVYGLWGDLPDGAFRLLTYMAAVSLDDDDPARFYAGRETLAYAMGWHIADERTTDPTEIAKRESAFKSVKRLVGILKKAGAICVLRPAAPGRTAEYGLNLKVSRPMTGWDRSRPRGQVNRPHSGPDETAAETSPEGNGANSFDGTGPKDLAERGQVNRRTGPRKLAPKEDQEQGRTAGEEEMADVDLTSHPPRASPPPESASVIQLFSKAPNQPPGIPTLRRGSRAQEALEQAAERRRRAVAEHQARLAAGDTP